MKLADFDQEGNIIGYYSPEIHRGKIPSNALEISEEEWLDCINNDGKYKIDPKARKLILAPPLTAKETRKRKLNELNKEYEPIFKSNAEACLAAIVDGNDTLLAELKTERSTLKEEYKAKVTKL